MRDWTSREWGESFQAYGSDNRPLFARRAVTLREAITLFARIAERGETATLMSARADCYSDVERVEATCADGEVTFAG